MSLKCLILAAVVMIAECSVIKIQEIPISDDMLMKIVVKEGSSDQSRKIASIKIDLEKIEPEEPPTYNPYPRVHDSHPIFIKEDISPPSKPGLHLEEPVSGSLKPQESKRLLPIFDLEKNISESKNVPPTTGAEEETAPKKDVPDFENRFGIGSGACGAGKIRKGQFCIPLGK